MMDGNTAHIYAIALHVRMRIMTTYARNLLIHSVLPSIY